MSNRIIIPPWLENNLIGAVVALSTGIYAYKVIDANQQSDIQRNYKPPKYVYKVPASYSPPNRKGQEFLDQNFVLSRTNLRAGRWWTLVTHTFNHASFMHLAFNMYGLYTYGNLLVCLIGPINTAIVYTGSAVAGAYLSLRYHKTGFIEGRGYVIDYGYLGASGSVLGLMTTFSAMFPFNMISVWPGFVIPAWTEMLGFAGYSYWAQTNGAQRDIGKFCNFTYFSNIMNGMPVA